jgi:ribosomal protein S18 acetylase RimI-like enzyme
VIGYRLPDEPEPIGDDMPPMFVPLLELENLAPGTWYVNVVATRPDHRGRGHGTKLLAIAEQLAEEAASRALSIIVSDGNLAARRLYGRLGYKQIAARPMVKENWTHQGRNWMLLVKPRSIPDEII